MFGGSRLISGIQTGQFFAELGKMSASDMFEQGQKTDANREQACQACGVAFILPDT